MNFKPVQKNRYFTAEKMYDQIEWSDFSEVVAAFQSRIREWYIEPIKVLKQAHHNYNFSIMALNCLLIDMLSQYYYGEEQSTGKTFKKFVRDNFPKFTEMLPNPISIRKNNKSVLLRDVADVLYTGFRCGILHEAHIPLYGGVAGANGEIFAIHPAGHVTYDDGTDCPSVIIEPYNLTLAIEQFFDDYIQQLRSRTQQQLEDNFRKKFTVSFGVII